MGNSTGRSVRQAWEEGNRKPGKKVRGWRQAVSLVGGGGEPAIRGGKRTAEPMGAGTREAHIGYGSRQSAGNVQFPDHANRSSQASS